MAATCKYSDEEMQAAVSLAKELKSIRGAAKQLGIPEKTVSRWVNCGTPPNRSIPKSELLQELSELIIRNGPEIPSHQYQRLCKNPGTFRKYWPSWVEFRNEAAKLCPFAPEYNRRIFLEVKEGLFLGGSDFHYWPYWGQTTSHRALLYFAKKLKPTHLILNGDVPDFPQITHHRPIAWKKIPNLRDELNEVLLRVGETEGAAAGAEKYWNYGNHCLDASTECLTKRGWVKYTDILQSDSVFSLVDGRGAWSEIGEIIRIPYRGDLVRIEKNSMSMAVTPDHRVLLSRLNWKTKQYDITEYRRANDLPSSFNIPMSARVEMPDLDIQDDAISLCGWILTDGSIYESGAVFLFQSKPYGIERIAGLLDGLGLEYTRTTRYRERRAVCGRELLKDPLPSTSFYVKIESSRKIHQWLSSKKKLPEWAGKLSNRQFQILLDSIVDGDGTWNPRDADRKNSCVIYGEKEFLESIQGVSVCHGWRTRLVKDNRGDYRLWLAREEKLRIEPDCISTEPYDGMVWCLSVPHSNFMVRRNGCAYFTGNCIRFDNRLAEKVPEYQDITGTRLSHHFPRWKFQNTIRVNDTELEIKHRYRGGELAVRNNVIRAGISIWTGHDHNREVWRHKDLRGTRYGMNPGMAADPWGPQFEYNENHPSNHDSGLLVVQFRNYKMMPPELIETIEPGVVWFRGERHQV